MLLKDGVFTVSRYPADNQIGSGPGSIGAQTRVKSLRVKMPGHYGNATKTITGLKIVSLNKETHLIYVSGSVPGAFNSWVTLKKFMKTDLYNLKGEKSGI